MLRYRLISSIRNYCFQATLLFFVSHFKDQFTRIFANKCGHEFSFQSSPRKMIFNEERITKFLVSQSNFSRMPLESSSCPREWKCSTYNSNFSFLIQLPGTLSESFRVPDYICLSMGQQIPVFFAEESFSRTI